MSDKKFRQTICGSAEYSTEARVKEINLEALERAIKKVYEDNPRGVSTNYTIPDFGSHYSYDWDAEKPELSLRTDLYHSVSTPLDYSSEMMSPLKLHVIETWPIDFPGSCRYYASMKDCSFSDDIE